MSPGSNVGVVRFATGATEVLNFDSDQTRASLESVVQAQPYTQGSTYTRDAVDAALAMISAHGKGLPTVIVIVTDGIPNPATTQSPCPDVPALQADSAQVVVVGVGADINSTALACLYNNDPSRFIPATDFTASSLDSIRPLTDAFLCQQ